jgi:hypothetical protein
MFDSNYNSLQAQFQQRFRNHSIVVVNYTWSHALTDGSAVNSWPLTSQPQNIRDLRAEYGPSAYDRRQIFTAI